MSKDGSFLKETEALRDLRALEAIEKNPHVSQRELARSMGVALGIANACVHTLVRKGLVKIRGENNRTITYHLTKQGVVQKSALAMQWTMNTIDFYREARMRVARTLQRLAAEGVRTVVVWGATELTEIALIVAHPAGVEIVGVVGGPESYVAGVLGEVPLGDPALVASLAPDAIAVAEILPAEEIEELKRRIRAETGVARVCGLFEEEA